MPQIQLRCWKDLLPHALDRYEDNFLPGINLAGPLSLAPSVQKSTPEKSRIKPKGGRVHLRTTRHRSHDAIQPSHILTIAITRLPFAD